MKLGVNIDHVATIREARGGSMPDPVAAAVAAAAAGADSIVAHLREDRRHINDRDVEFLRRKCPSKFNLEMSVACDVVKAACRVKPDQATLVPERRQELTTECGLDAVKHFKKVSNVVRVLEKQGIIVSLFIDPDKEQIKASRDLGVPMIELHTGCYANASAGRDSRKCLAAIERAVDFARTKGIVVNAGHGLDYHNVVSIARIKGIEELNIGHSIISRAVFVGLNQAVKEMLALIGRSVK